MSRAIDAMVAEKVMGWQWQVRLGTPKGWPKDKWCFPADRPTLASMRGGLTKWSSSPTGDFEHCGLNEEEARWYANGIRHENLPHYSTDPAACRELIDHHQTGYVEIHNGWGEVNGERVGGWHCRIVPPGPHEGVAREPTLEMAVCVACLRAEGVPEDQIEKARNNR